MQTSAFHIGVVIEGACFTIEQLASACAVSPEWVQVHVREGRLPMPAGEPASWRFGARELWRAREMRRLECDFDAEPELAALVADLMEELAVLRQQLRGGALR